MDTDTFLAAYDAQLRGPHETPSQLHVETLGPVRLVTFAQGRGFITYPNPGHVDRATLLEWVEAAQAHFRSIPGMVRVEWKARGHDDIEDLDAVLADAGFVPEETESIMIGEARALAAEVPLKAGSDGVEVRRIEEEAEVRAASAMQHAVFEEDGEDTMAEIILARLAAGTAEMWAAFAGDQVVSAGTLEPVPDSDFAGIWGGSTLPQWRGRGIYRALTAARARSALEAGRSMINSDSTAFSRPILERSGLVRVSTTTPHIWKPEAPRP